jgi:hypothetical protein
VSLTRAAILVLAAVVLAGTRDAAAQCNKAYTTCQGDLVAQLPASCCPGGTCTLGGTITVPPGAVCDFNFGARHVNLSGTFAVGNSTVTIEAESFHIKLGGQLLAVGQNGNPGGKVTITTGGIFAGSSFSMDAASAVIDLSGQGSGAGMLAINAAGPVLLEGGNVTADGTGPGANGGNVMIDSTAGDIKLAANIFARAAQPGGRGGLVRVKGAGRVTLAGNKTILLDGGRAGGGTLDVDAALGATFALGSKVRASGIDGSGGQGGVIQVAAASIEALGELRSEGGNIDTGFGGDGGSIALEARTGALHTELLSVEGSFNGNGGDITLVTDSLSVAPTDGTIRISGTVTAQAKLGDGGGGIVDLISAGGILVEAGAPINVNGSRGGGGTVTMNAVRDIEVNSSIMGNDQSGGGQFTIDGSRDTVLNADLNMRAEANFDGDGGEVIMVASRDFTLRPGKTVDVSGAGAFDGGTIEVLTGRNLSVENTARMTAEGGAGDGTPESAGSGGAIALAAGDAGQPGNLTVRGFLSAGSRPPNGGTIELSGCTVTLTGTVGVLTPGPSSLNLVTARSALLSSGNVRAEISNTANIPVGAPAPSNAGVVPPWTTSPRAVCTAPATPSGCLTPCPTCGNNVVEFPEECDQTGDRCTTQCSPSCRTEICGNGIPCRQSLCDPQAGCFAGPAPNGAACDDTTLCNGNETCLSGFCVPGPPPDCDDGNPCTTDCHPVQGCNPSPVQNGTSCADGNLCDGTEQCLGGVCEAGTRVVCPVGQSCVPATGTCMATPCSGAAECNDDNPCTNDVCNGTCSNTSVPNGTACPDSNVCNGAETCSAGVCTPGDPLALDDGNACTVDDCDPVAGPTHTPVPGCRPCTTNPQCNDDNACTTDTCLPDNTCDSAPIPDCCVTAADCDDGNPCTTESCPAGTCSRANVAGPCGDACQPGTCQAGTCNLDPPVTCTDDGNACTVEVCDVLLGGCTSVTLEDCCSSDGPCADGDTCTTDTCDLEAHRCANTRIDDDCRSCEDNLDCDPLGRCGQSICAAGGTCVANTPPDCRDDDPNTRDICEPDAAGEPVCIHQCLNAQPCDDGNACNGVEICSGGACAAGTPLTCDDGDLCTDETCDPVAGCQPIAKTGFASVRCRLDTMVQALAAASEQGVAAKVRNKVSKQLTKGGAKLATAEAAGQGRPAVKALRAVGKSLKKLSNAVRGAQRKQKIQAALADLLLDRASEAGRVVSELRASVI